jgi:hypothetical protein
MSPGSAHADRGLAGFSRGAIPVAASQRVSRSNDIRSFGRGKRISLPGHLEPRNDRAARSALTNQRIHSNSSSARAGRSNRRRDLPGCRSTSTPTHRPQATASRRSPRRRARRAEDKDESQSCRHRKEEITQFATVIALYNESAIRQSQTTDCRTRCVSRYAARAREFRRSDSDASV